jgi:hypothetical protein
VEFSYVYRRQKAGTHSAGLQFCTNFSIQQVCSSVPNSAFSRSEVLYQNRFFNAFVTYKELLKNFKHFTLYDRKRYFDALFFLSFRFSLFFLFLSLSFPGLKCCPSLLSATGIRVPFVILGSPICPLLQVKTLQLQDAFWLQILCLKMLISLGILVCY